MARILRPAVPGPRAACRASAPVAGLLLGIVAALAAVAPAWGGDPARTRAHGTAGPIPAEYALECGECHVPYPARMLPRESWRRIAASLPSHYGVDASLEPATLDRIARWLASQAGASRRVAEPPPEDRITRSGWFEREHRDVPASIRSLPSVRSMARCDACHLGTERGAYDDDRLRVPEGAPAAATRAWRD